MSSRENLFDKPRAEELGSCAEAGKELLKMNLFGMTLPELQDLCAQEQFPRYTAKQICDWLYCKRVDEISQMTNLSLKTRARLEEVSEIRKWHPIDCQTSRDGTKKYLFPAEEGQYIETVFLPEGDRATLCISCQKGCKMSCQFCVTGRQGFHGHLSTAQILNQIFSIPEFGLLTNVVYMGMGEPMDNYDHVLASTQVLTSDWGLAWSPKRITVSSVGVTPRLRQFIRECDCHIAVSLHDPFDDERLLIMPAQKAYPISGVIQMLKEFDWSGQRRISFEYTMFQGVNDTERHARELVRLLKPIPCRVNLIRFHANPEAPFKTCSPAVMNGFRDYLNNHGITCTIRASRGEDIMAACGLLAGKKKSQNGGV